MKTADIPAILVEGAHSGAFVARVRAKVGEALRRIRPVPTAAKVVFADENGPKGGVDTRCTIVTEMPRRRANAVTELGDSLELAFDTAFAALETSIARDRERWRELVRRPKKYYLAKRLLSPDSTLAAPEAPPLESTRPKRQRRRNVA
jgi:hypothetical protein